MHARGDECHGLQNIGNHPLRPGSSHHMVDGIETVHSIFARYPTSGFMIEAFLTGIVRGNRLIKIAKRVLRPLCDKQRAVNRNILLGIWVSYYPSWAGLPVKDKYEINQSINRLR